MNIYGGTGGNGGGAGTAGRGGGGGVGEGPRFNYDINAEAFTVNLVVQGQEREIPGATRNSRRQLRTMSTPYGLPTPARFTLTQSAGLHRSSSEQPVAASDTSLRSLPQFRTRTASSIALPPFQILLPASESPSVSGNRTGHASSLNLPPLRLALHDRQSTRPASSDERGHSPSTLDSHSESRAGSSGSEPSVAALGRPSYIEPALGHSGTSITFNQRQGEVGIHMLHRAAAQEALFDAAERFGQPRCHPETRTELLGELYAWAINPNSVRSILWLHGPAGAGKSAVMQSLCQRLQEAGRLGGSFFFKRGHPTCGNAKMLFATLAYQLALSRDELKSPISRSAEMDPSVLGRGMDVQLRALILEPCQLLEDETPSVLLIDGLDECDGHRVQQELLRLIRPAARCSLRILVASRAEPHIREMLEDPSFEGLYESANIEQSFNDVRTYMLEEFSRIHHEHHAMKNIPTPWPSADVLEQLVEKSSGYFIYASTVVKFVDDEYSRPTKQLDIIRNLAPQDSQFPFATLDQLYFQILSEVPVRSRRVLCDILSVIVDAPEGDIELCVMDELLDLQLGDTELILRPLHSIIDLAMVSVHHASFTDFLINEARSSIFYVGSPQQKFRLACSILGALAYGRDTICSFRWHLGVITALWISHFCTPSAELVPFVERVNPDFILRFAFEPNIKVFLRWLKKISPPPDHLIDRWETFRFIGLYERFEDSLFLDSHEEPPLGHVLRPVWAPSPTAVHTLHDRMDAESQSALRSFGTLMSQSPTLVRVLQARRLLLLNQNKGSPKNNLGNKLGFFEVRAVLDISWDDIVQCMRSLRPFLTRHHNFPILFLLHPALCHLDVLYPDSVAARDVAYGFLRLMKRVHGGGHKVWNDLVHGGYAEWGRYIRLVLPLDPAVLRELDGFSPLSIGDDLKPEDIHDVLQWLKESPSTRPDLIHRWQGYLDESLDRDTRIYDHDDLEKRWQNHWSGESCLYGPEIEEEMVRYWEDCLDTDIACIDHDVKDDPTRGATLLRNPH